MAGNGLPMLFQPPRVYVLADVFQNPDAARRADRICSACPDAEVRTFAYADLPDIVREEGWTGAPRMGTMADVPPPIPILTLYRFDEEAVRADADRMRAACPEGAGFGWNIAAGGERVRLVHVRPGGAGALTASTSAGRSGACTWAAAARTSAATAASASTRSAT